MENNNLPEMTDEQRKAALERAAEARRERTNKERQILKRKAKKVGLTVSDFVRSSLIHSDNLTITVIDTSVLNKTLFELHKHGVNLNQLMKFCKEGTLGAIRLNDMKEFYIN